MADFPKFDGFSLQDDNYIISNVEYRTIPTRTLDLQKIARKPGVKFLSTEFAEKKVRFSGYIIASSSSELQTKIDDFHSNVTRKTTGVLEVESGRQANATVSSVTITDPQYAQDMVPIEMEFIMDDPFFYNSVQHGHTWAVTSGTVSQTFQITISGSVFAEPSIVYSAPGTSGNTLISALNLQYVPTSEIITWSGSSGTGYLAYANTVSLNYGTQTILEGTTEVTTSGVFSRWEPGLTSFVISFKDQAPGGTLSVNYYPRYL